MNSRSGCATASDRRGRGGFTLVELLAATLLLGLIAAALAGAMRFGARSWERGAGPEAAAEDGFAAAATFVRRVLTEAYPLSRLDGGTRRVAFVGRANAVEFVGLMPEGAASPGLQAIALIATPDGRLVARWRPIDGDGPPRERSLVDGLATARLAYWGRADRGGSGAWATIWPASEFPPQLIRLELVPRNGQVWPAIVAAPQILLDSLVSF